MASTKPKRNSKQKKTTNLRPFEHVYEIVRRIPRGKVATYGSISKRMNGRLSAAAVGWAMNGLGGADEASEYNSKNVPWHRVINSKGKISTQLDSGMTADDGRPVSLQRLLLEKEGVRFDEDDCVDLGRCLWSDVE